MFMEELNLISAPLQLRMLWKILRFKLLLFLKLFVISQLFHPILQPEGVSDGAGTRRSPDDDLHSSLVSSYIA